MTKYIAKKPDKNGYIHFTEDENTTWQILYERQIKTIQNRACGEFIEGLQRLNMSSQKIPQCPEISNVLQATTGWSVAPVDTIIPLEKFFSLLANRQFPAACFIRLREELDYLQEPDIFHEFFGHCPLLTNLDYADFVQWYGETALRMDNKTQSLLGRLFWFTIEFGLIQTNKGLRIYGGGILSSYQETIFALESDLPKRFPFDLRHILDTAYRYDEIQKCYFIINDLKELFKLKSEIVEKISQTRGDGQDDNFVIC